MRKFKKFDHLHLSFLHGLRVKKLAYLNILEKL